MTELELLREMVRTLSKRVETLSQRTTVLTAMVERLQNNGK